MSSSQQHITSVDASRPPIRRSQGTVTLITHANRQVGWGHLNRTLSLRSMLADSLATDLVVLEADKDVRGWLDGQGTAHRSVAHPDDLLKTLPAADPSTPGWVIFDGYRFDHAFRAALREESWRTAVVDDFCEGRFEDQLIINHTPGATASDYDRADRTRVLAGLDYALLRPPFLSAAKADVEFAGEQLFVSFGAADPFSLADKAIDEALRHAWVEHVHVVGSAKNTALRDRQPDRVSEYHGLGAQQMAQLMQRCRYALLPASGLSIERIATQGIAGVGWFVDNQKRIYDGLLSESLIFGLDALPGSERPFKAFFENIDAIRQGEDALLARQRRAVDGNSGGRIVDALLSANLS